MSKVPLFTSGPGTPVSFFWDFGDGTTSTEPSPVNIYANAGTYNVTMVMTYAGGPCGEVTYTDTFSMRVSISASCYANFTVDAPPGESYAILTDYSTTNCPSGISKWIVDWDDGTVDTFIALKGQITHAYSHEGYYKVKVYIEDKCGHSDIRHNIVYVKKCCLSWDTQKDTFYFGGNNKYYLKAKFILRGSLWILSHVAAKSTLYRKFRGRYVRARANTIQAAFNGYVWKNFRTYDSNQDCYAIDRVQRFKSKKFRSSVTVSQYKPFNWWYGIQARYRSILGGHYVIKSSNSKLVNWYIHEMQC